MGAEIVGAERGLPAVYAETHERTPRRLIDLSIAASSTPSGFVIGMGPGGQGCGETIEHEDDDDRARAVDRAVYLAATMALGDCSSDRPRNISTHTREVGLSARRDACGTWTFSSGAPSALIQGGPDGVEQGFAVERLAEERDGAGLQGALACLVVAVSSQNDHRKSGARVRQVSEEVETIHSGHPEIEHQTAGLFLMDGLQEGFGRCERLDAEADRSQEIPQGPTQRFVVVHDGNYLCVIFGHEFQSVSSVRIGVHLCPG